jgi:PEGA domain
MSRAAHYFRSFCQSCQQALGHRGLWMAAVAVLLLVPSGCVRRRLTVRSNPPGALVYVDNQQIGTTPCAVDFTYYGTREIRLVKPGYETLTVNQPIPTPWYEIPGVDFVSENLTPTKVRDNRTVMYDLSPQIIVPTQHLLDRAEELRQETMQGLVVPASVPPPANLPPPPGPAGPALPGTFVPPPSTSAPYSPLPPTMIGPPAAAPAPFAPPDLPIPLPAEPQRGSPIVTPSPR